MPHAKTLPALTPQHQLPSQVNEYLNHLSKSSFKGDVETNFSSRLVMATDNSVYQQLPQAVLYPKNQQDLELIGCIASQAQFQGIKFSARGGGTGTNGQSLTSGIVVDLSRHMNKILEINEAEGWVRVQAGVVKDQLNDAVRPLGYFFSPDLSTSNRATLGGMINTDASGQGSLKYGKTSDHVLGLTAVFADGSVYQTPSDDSSDEPKSGTYAHKAYQVTQDLCRTYRQAIEAKFPPLNRFLTGYDLKNALDFSQDPQGHFDFSRILCGSEGSLAFICEAKLNLTKIPRLRTLINISYDSFDSALRSAPTMVEANALSVETVDSKVLNLAKEDIIWHTVSDLFSEANNEQMQGINIIEFAGDDEKEMQLQVDNVVSTLDHMLEQKQGGILGYHICDDLASINKVYAMRKKAVGLLGAAKGRAKPLPFAEDTCVPPENLADFIVEFRALLDAHNLQYGMFGHVDAGVLHVRPALDLCDENQEALMHQISDQVVALVAKYGGLMWGEHGKGYRSQYGPEFFGEELFNVLRQIKAAFDPHNQMNPGKICTPIDSNESLVQVSDTKRAFYDRQIPIEVKDSYRAAMDCNGNGLCFNYDVNSPMCPSMKITADRRHSPKGRAGLVREWLRQLTEQGIDILALEKEALNGHHSIKSLLNKVKHCFSGGKEYDFSHEVHQSLNLCLACKACASQCPIQVDVPSFRSRFLAIYHTRYPRPLKDHLVANIETMLPLMAKAPKLVNVLATNSLSEWVAKKGIGYVDTPTLSTPTLAKRVQALETKMQKTPASHNKLLAGQDWDSRFSMSYLQSLSSEEKAQHVLIVQDPFTSFYEAEVVEDMVRLALSLGKKPILLPFKPNGKAQHIKGFLKRFAHSAQNTGEFLSQIARLNIPMIGIDPAMVLCYRDEYKEIKQQQGFEFEVLLVHEWLTQYALSEANQVISTQHQIKREPWYLLGHCTEKTKLPNAQKQWVDIFSHFGSALESVAVGCCGMAGTFGHEADKFELSQGIYKLSWQTNLERLPMERCLATGYSCRSQVKRFEQTKLKHPLQALLSLLEG